MFWAWGPLGAILAIPLTLTCKAILVDVDPQARRARWAEVLLRASAKDPDPAAPTKKSRRRAGHTPPATDPMPAST